MTDRCEEFDRVLDSAPVGDAEERWRQHLAGCDDCREQAAADALLRDLSLEPPLQPAAGFEGRLRRRLEHHLEERPAPARRPGRLRPAALWTLAAYGSAGTLASVVVLSRLPWQSFTAPPALLITLAALALLSPLALLDRVGIVRPPG